VRVLVLSDTHVPDHAKALPEALVPHLERAELVLHAGDATSAATLEQLAAHAPLHAVLGNIDGTDVAAWGAPAQLELELGGVPVAMLHDAGPRAGRERRLRRRFPGAQLVVFGHSHIPLDEEHEGLHLLNPGSPTWKRRAPAPTLAWLDIARGRVRSRIVAL
jgi:uncharacterized protein